MKKTTTVTVKLSAMIGATDGDRIEIKAAITDDKPSGILIAERSPVRERYAMSATPVVAVPVAFLDELIHELQSMRTAMFGSPVPDVPRNGPYR